MGTACYLSRGRLITHFFTGWSACGAQAEAAQQPQGAWGLSLVDQVKAQEQQLAALEGQLGKEAYGAYLAQVKNAEPLIRDRGEK